MSTVQTHGPWTLDVSPHYVGASRGGHTQVGLCLDDDGDLDVDLEAGSGYMREHLTATVPLAVLLKLLEGRGYTVVVPSRGTP